MQLGLRPRLRYRSSLFELIHNHTANDSLYNDEFVRPQLDEDDLEELEEELELAQDVPLPPSAPPSPLRQRHKQGQRSSSDFWRILEGPKKIVEEEMAPVG